MNRDSSINAEITKSLMDTLNDCFISYLDDDQTISVEEIQDEVEYYLCRTAPAVAKAYILYREQHRKDRRLEDDLLTSLRSINSVVNSTDRGRENANVDGTQPMGVMLQTGQEASKYFYLKEVISPDIAKAHADGDIHIHDLDFYSQTTTCTQIDLKKLFHDGFNTGHGHLREPQSIGAAASLACIAIQSNQNQQHGGQSIPAFDFMLAPYVTKSFKKNMNLVADLDKEYSEDAASSDILSWFVDGSNTIEDCYYKAYDYDLGNYLRKAFDYDLGDYLRKAFKLTERDVYQAMEALIHNLNTMHSRAGAQVPFSSINYGTDTSIEGRLITKQLLLATQAGLGNGETPIFPVQIFKLEDGVNYKEGDPNYDLKKLACETSCKRLFPNFSNLDAPYNAQFYKGSWETEVAYMGCRTRVMANPAVPENEVTPGRGNLSFTSINLPRLAIETEPGGNIDDFYRRLDDMMELTKRQLLHRFKLQGAKLARNYEFLMGEGVWIDSDKLGPNDTVEEVLKNGTLSIGFIGLAETLVALTGEHHGESGNAQALGLEIISRMRDKCDEFTKETGLNFTLLATPAEGLSGRFVRIDKCRYGVIEGVTDREYYTNSFHVPVYYPTTAAHKIDVEAPYHALCNAGHISYVELDGAMKNNPEAFESVIDYMHDSGIGYGSVNHPLDRCPVCGYQGVIGNVCPQCGVSEEEAHFSRIRRITGYLVGDMDRWNDAKRAEEHDRVKHE